ncbi:MAG TPA: hypothetical protein VN513_07710 [Gemmatimonadales bacterium]|nr:hypothetical protein [Gemmatimonadales bacterium]
MVSTRLDTVGGDLRVEDPDGIDSVWVKLERVEQGFDGAFLPSFSTHYRFVVQGFSPSDQIPLVLRARDVAGFEVQRDTYVVVIP